MKVLLRQFNNEDYVWKDATYDGAYFVVDSCRQQEVNIVSVSEDDRSEYVRCSACGKIFRKESPEIEEHKNKYKDINACLSCRNLHKDNRVTISETIEHIDGANYKIVSEATYVLRCSRACSWMHGYDSIDKDSTRESCMFRRCATADYNEIQDIFTMNPGIFDDIITVDKIIPLGYKREQHFYGGDAFYSLKGRNQIEAYVNRLNIVDYFEVKYGRHSWRVYYSKKLDKLFMYNNGNYGVWNPIEMGDNTKNYIKARIAELYN